MANTFSDTTTTGAIICKLAAGRFKEKALFCSSILEQDSSVLEGKNGYKAGSTVKINVPPVYNATTAFDITSNIQDTVETTKDLPIDIISNVAMKVDSLELATEDDFATFMTRHGNSAIDAISANVESRVIEKCTDAVYASVGTAGSETFEYDTFGHAKQKLDEQLAPTDGRYTLMDAYAMRKATNSAKGYLNPQGGISKMYETGTIKDPITGFDFMQNQLLNSHTNGNDVTFEVRTTVSVEGQATLVVEGLTTTTGTVTKGTVFTIDTVFDVDPLTKADLTTLKQFTVTADATADGSGYATLSISPALYTSASNGLETVSAFPADGDTCNPVGAASTAYTQNIAYQKSAFRFISVPLEMPKNEELVGQYTEGGITIALVRSFDILLRDWVTRFDFLGGVSVVRPEWATRITA
jgi:hypothetical protein